MTMWTVVIIVGVATLGLRFVFIGLFDKVNVPPTLERALRYIAPAVLAALALPAIVRPDGDLTLWNPLVPAAVLGALAAWKTGNIGAAIVVGLPALWLLQWLT